MAKHDDDDDGGIYGFAPEEPIGVSTAATCSARLTTSKRRAVKSYISVLGPALREQYGRERYYSPSQVRGTLLACGLSIDYMCWAYLLHCSATDFARIHNAAGEFCDYDAMRSAVGGAFFDGHADFSTSAIIDLIDSGAAKAAAEGMKEMIGWLGDVDWGDLLNWSS